MPQRPPSEQIFFSGRGNVGHTAQTASNPTLTQSTGQFVAQAEQDASPAGQVIERRWATSEVRRIPRPGQPAVYRKQFALDDELGVTPEVIRSRTACEISLIQQLASLKMGGRLRTPKLIAGDPDSGVLVTEEVPGRPLERYVTKQYRRRVDRQCQQAMLLAGRWLRHFQSLPIEDDNCFSEAPSTKVDGPKAARSSSDPLLQCPASVTDLIEYCDVRLQAVGALGYRWVTESVRRQIRQALAVLGSQASENDRRLVWSHGDYSPGNVIWDGRTLTPIDFAMSHPDFPLTDVTYFIHRLEMLAVYFPWRRWPLAAWRKAVLRGYGRPDADQSPMYRALMIRHLCCRLKTYVRRRPVRRKERLHNRWVRWQVRRRLAALAEEI